MSSPAELQAGVAGRFALEALRLGEGEVCATFRRSFYLEVKGKYACVGDPSLGRGPLNALVRDFAMPAIGERLRVLVDHAVPWEPRLGRPSLDPRSLRAAPIPPEGLGCLILGKHNGLAMHAQPALDAIDRWLEGHSLAQEAELLIGLGPGLTPSGDDYFGGVLVALHAMGRSSQAQSLWRWLEPRLAARTSAISAAHLAAAAAGQAHEALHDVLDGNLDFKRLDEVGHTSGWDALAGATAVIAKG
ncbi:MAG: oxamate carbamoyltransferase subunit AllH family protein [Betaproteobacteria bacterium]